MKEFYTEIIELQSGVYLSSQEDIVIEQRSADDEDPDKNYDFTTHAYWMTTDNGIDPIGFDSIEEARDYLK